MAHFLETQDQTGETVFVNFDYVVRMKPSTEDAGYTTIFFRDDKTLTVTLPAAHLLDRLRSKG